MRKLLVAISTLAALSLAVYGGRLLFASDETRIRWRLEAMAEDFNRGRAGACAGGLTEDFREETSGLGKREIRLALSRMVFSKRHPETREFLYRVHIVPDSLVLGVEQDGDRKQAAVELIARFTRGREGSRKLVWEVAIEATMAETDEGWQVARARHETLRGETPR